MSQPYKLVSKMFIAGAAGLLVSLSAFAADVTGNWNLTVENPRGTSNPTMALVQKGEEVTGTYKSQRGEMPVTGTIKGNDLKLSYTVNAGGQELKIQYEGTVDGDNIAGKVIMGQMGEGKFTAKKAP